MVAGAAPPASSTPGRLSPPLTLRVGGLLAKPGLIRAFPEIKLRNLAGDKGLVKLCQALPPAPCLVICPSSQVFLFVSVLLLLV